MSINLIELKEYLEGKGFITVILNATSPTKIRTLYYRIQLYGDIAEKILLVGRNVNHAYEQLNYVKTRPIYIKYFIQEEGCTFAIECT